ncbi:hybrid sensor histidine kinase/response regulator [Sorangium atrum]|uniref:histidine kinase n=1 Tax=Sorangium atrum TaxID=2995308 RepID=A0ABT5BZ80_9BACT|nr:ATP-binding protein [Sorangium aterium]MDC0678743.1 ATP-binding protein [Sorangium aterium]
MPPNPKLVLAAETPGQARARHAHLRILAKAASRLVLCDEPSALLGSLFEELANDLGVELYFNYMIGDEPNTLVLESAAGISPEDEQRYRTIRFGQFMCGTVAATRMPLIAFDLQRSTLECGSELKKAGVQAYAGYPLISHDRLLGTLAFATSKRSHMDADELSLMQTLSVQVAAVLERNRLCRSLRASEQAAQRHLALLQNVYSTAPVGLCFLDRDLRYVSVNETLARITGRPISEHLGRTLGEFIPEVTPFKDLCERVLETGQEVTDRELRVARPEGDHDWLVSVHPVRDEAGTMLGINVVVQEVTERKQAEQALLESEQALRAADRRKDEFLVMLAHELRNPLAPIRTAIQVLDITGGDAPEAVRTREMIERQVAHMARMIDDLLDVSRIARGKIELRKEPCDLARIVRQVTDDYAPTFRGNGIELLVSLPDEPVWVSGDHTRLAQVIGNLLHNALKFTDAGGRVGACLETDPATNTAVIVVEDSGIGMDPSMIPLVFETFSQADSSLDRRRGGLGLGLSLVHSLIAMHGGSVEAHSEGPGLGSTFRVRLPLSSAPVRSIRRPEPVRPATASREESLRVLVVEDNRDMADILKQLLALLGYQAEVAYTGPAGLAMGRTLAPDVVLCDLGLPGMDGYALARALRADPATARAYLIAQTGYGHAEDRRRAREAGFDLHMTKPIDPIELERVLSSVGTRAQVRTSASQS